MIVRKYIVWNTFPYSCLLKKPCQNGAACSVNDNSTGNYECACAAGYSGKNCSVSHDSALERFSTKGSQINFSSLTLKDIENDRCIINLGTLYLIKDVLKLSKQ